MSPSDSLGDALGWMGDEDHDPFRTARHAGRPQSYRCLECDWCGSEGVKAADHHVRSGHHRVQLVNGPTQLFSCCQAPDWREDAAERATFEADSKRTGLMETQPDLLGDT